MVSLPSRDSEIGLELEEDGTYHDQTLWEQARWRIGSITVADSDRKIQGIIIWNPDNYYTWYIPCIYHVYTMYIPRAGIYMVYTMYKGSVAEMAERHPPSGETGV